MPYSDPQYPRLYEARNQADDHMPVRSCRSALPVFDIIHEADALSSTRMGRSSHSRDSFFLPPRGHTKHIALVRTQHSDLPLLKLRVAH
jgi:hypothetical protein